MSEPVSDSMSELADSLTVEPENGHVTNTYYDLPETRDHVTKPDDQEILEQFEEYIVSYMKLFISA